MSPHRRDAWKLASLLGLIVALVLLYPDVTRVLSGHPPVDDSGLPPAFSGNRAAYGFALFSLFSISSVAIRKLLLILSQLRAENWREAPDIGLYRIALALLLTTIILGAAPDVALMLLWGEASRETLVGFMTFDRICDGLTIGPFLLATVILIRAEQLEAIPLSRFIRAFDEPQLSPVDRALYLVVPAKDGIGDHVRIVVAVLVIALGLAVLK